MIASLGTSTDTNLIWLGINDSQQFYSGIFGDTGRDVDAGQAVTIQWVHLLAVVTSNTLELYKNGTLLDSASYSSFTPGSSPVLYLGTRANASGGPESTRYLDCSISNFKLWNVALTAEEVAMEYALGRTGKSLNLTDTALCLGGTVPRAQLDVRGGAMIDSGLVIKYKNSLEYARDGGIMLSRAGLGNVTNKYSSQPIVLDGGDSTDIDGNIRGGAMWSQWGGAQYGIAMRGANYNDTYPYLQDPTLFVTNDKIGIGTASPGAKLHILDQNLGDATELLRLQKGYGTGDIGDTSVGHIGMYLVDANEGGGEVARISYGHNGGDGIPNEGRGKLGFWTSNTGGAEGVPEERMTIRANGNVGIGTTSPAYKLDVNGTVNTGALTATTGTFSGPDQVDSFDAQCIVVSSSTTGAINSGGVLAFQGYDGANQRGFATVSGLKENGTSGNYATYLRFSTRTDGVSSITERMRITSTGNVGIGENSPNYKLDVNGTVNTGALTATSATVPNDGDFVMGGKPLKPAVGLHWDRVNSRLEVNGLVGTSPTGGIIIPSGTTAQQPTGVTGMLRFNTTFGKLQVYDGNLWIDVGPNPTNAIGGTVTYTGGYTIHTFTSSDTFTVYTGGDVEYLVVAGGASGAVAHGTNGVGGGGAGGLLTGSTSVTAGTYTITIGSGGTGFSTATPTSGNSGTDSSISGLGIIATGGGGGGGAGTGDGLDGGSGGGAATYNVTTGSTQARTGGSGVSGQGNDGRSTTGVSGEGGGGGGGAGATGGTIPSNGVGGAGGIGIQSSISGTATYYAGGGGATGWESSSGGSGGSGGGGAAGTKTTNATNATDGLGGGGGGAKSGKRSGDGGDGIVIIRYLT
jgi:hypothetical protein